MSEKSVFQDREKEEKFLYEVLGISIKYAT